MNIDTVSNNLLAEVRGRVGILWLRRPPSNAMASKFSADVRQGLTVLLDHPDIDCVVLTSGLVHFSAGSDAADFTQPQRDSKVEISALCQMVSESKKPIVAAIHGACLSTGLELAISAKARIALAGAQFAFPEIKLGLMPAAGSTLRLPELIGPEPALTMLLEGNAINADQAAEIDLIDVLVRDDLVQAACDFALELVAGARPLRRRDRAKDARALQEAIVAARAKYAGRRLACYDKIISCVEASQIFLPAQALALEQSAYESLLFSDDTQGLCYALLANQRLRGLAFTQTFQIPTGVAAVDVAHINLFGTGELVAQLAHRALIAGLQVRLVNPQQDMLMNSLLRIAALFVQDIALGRMDVKTRDMHWARLRSSKDKDLFGDAPIIFSQGDAFDGDISLCKSDQALPSQKAALVINETNLNYVIGSATTARTGAFLAGLFVKMGIATYDLARGGFVDTQIKDVMSRAINHLQRQGHERDLIIAALAASGVGVDTNTALPTAPPKAKVIVSAIQLAMINRGAMLLRQGHIPRATDYDALVLQAGLFPRWLGGPFRLADRRGLMVVRADLRKLAADAPDLFTPDPLIDQMIAKAQLFTQ